MAGGLFAAARQRAAVKWGQDKALDFARGTSRDTGILLTRAPRKID